MINKKYQMQKLDDLYSLSGRYIGGEPLDNYVIYGIFVIEGIFEGRS